MGWFKKKQTIDELGQALKPVIAQRDEAQLCKLLDEIIAHIDSEPQKVEGFVGYAVLAACENRFTCAGKYLKWFMDRFPDSLAPVKIEYATVLADRQPDSATQLAREYLRVVAERGVLPNIASMPMVQRGTSKAFLVFTSAYTTAGARSYSKRVLEYALNLPLDPHIKSQYAEEINRLETELLDSQAKAMDGKWESFFNRGENATQLHQFCQQQNYPLLAERVDLIEGQFRFQPGYTVDSTEWFRLIKVGQTPDGTQVRMLA